MRVSSRCTWRRLLKDVASKNEGSNTADFLAALSSPTRKQPGFRCRVSVILESLEPDVRVKVQSILDELRANRVHGTPTEYTGTWLANTLTEHGFKISTLTMNVHVRKACSCE